MQASHITRRGFAAMAGAALLVSATGRAGAQVRPVIATDSYPLAWFAERLVGGQADVLFPVGPDVDPSFWRPGVADISAIQAASLIALNGANFAAWTARVSLPRARTVDTSASFAARYIATDTITHAHGADGEHAHTGTASYTWLDFAQAGQQAAALAAALTRVLPEAATVIATAERALAADLAALDTLAREVGAMGADLPVITSHPRYQYFGRAYGLTLAAVEWDARVAPTPDQLQALAALVATTKARVMIWEAAPDPATRDQVAALGLVNVVMPPLANRPASGDFLSVMQMSLADLRRAFEQAGAG